MRGLGSVPNPGHVIMGLELRKNMKRDVDPIDFKSLVGSLRHLTCTRLDILYGVWLANKNMETLN